MAVCPIGAAEPIVDGDLSDPIWRQAAMLGPFVAVATHDLPTQTTHCRAIRAAECLFVSFECYEADMSNLCMDVSESDDSRAWADDCVHLFIAPDDPRNQYYHVVVTAANVVLDESVREAAQDRQPNWDGEIRSATRHLEDRWTCEVALPFAPLTGSSPTGGVWSFNVGRAERAHGEWSSWAPLDASFHEFANFGSLLWSDGPVVTGIDIPAPFIGRNEFRLCIGVVAEPCVAELQAIRGDEVFPKLPVPLSGDVAAAWGYEITSEGQGAVRLVVHSPDRSQTYYASAPVAFDVPALSGLLSGVEARLAELRRECRSLESEGLRELLERDIEWLAEDTGAALEAAKRVVGRGADRAAAWQEQYEHARNLARAARALEHKCHLARSGPAALSGFSLGTESALRKVPPDDWEYSKSRELALSCTRRERESGQVIVASLGGVVRNVAVDWTGLHRDDGATIPRESIAVSRAGYVETRRPVYPVERVGRWPDPLLPPEPFTLPAKEVQPLWVTVSVPADAEPGLYRGRILVSAEAEGTQAVVLSVNVWDLTLPLHGKFQTGFGMVFGGDVSQWYGLRGDPGPEVRRRFHKVLLDNRVNPAGLYEERTWPPIEDVAWCREHGMNAISLGSLGAADPQRLASLTADALALRERGLLEDAYLFGFGSLLPDGVRSAAEAFDRARKQLPGVRRACPVSPSKPLWGHANRWGTLLSDYDHQSAQRRRYLGDDVWWYVCCGPRHPYPNLFIDYPATDARVMFWAAHKYGVTGFFYYEVAMWASNMVWEDLGDPSMIVHEDPVVLEAIKEGRRWPQVPWNTFTFGGYNGDGLLIYPGRNCSPLPSLRLEIVRDGIEDYELLVLLETLARELKAKDTADKYGFIVDEAMHLTNVSTKVVGDLTHFTSDPDIILAQRNRAAGQALRIRRLLRELETE